MPHIRFVTFDCAGTLIQVDRPLVQLALMAADEHGLSFGQREAQQFELLYVSRLAEFHRLNRLRSLDPLKGFWRSLSRDWLTRIGADPELAEVFRARVDELAFTLPSAMFSLYPDTLPCLEQLRDRGISMAVISNWDATLHRVLDMFGLSPYFTFELASLEEGMEKPDPRLFELALASLDAEPEQTAHVGDDPLDDVEGARSVGMRAVLIDRSGATGDAIRSLEELGSVLWND
jgi:REG-2-like HAD superfamily hydrolase